MGRTDFSQYAPKIGFYLHAKEFLWQAVKKVAEITNDFFVVVSLTTR